MRFIGYGIGLALLSVMSASAAGDASRTEMQAWPPQYDCFGLQVCVETLRYTDRAEIWLKYGGDGPVTVSFQPQAIGENEEVGPIDRRLLQAERAHLMTLTGQTARGYWQLRWRIWAHPGIQTALHDDSVVYELPYAAGTKHTVSQGFEGKHGHIGPDRYAIDFDMPEGTTIHAARGGWVHDTRDDSTSRRAGQENYVYIEHDDGTMGQYLHLRRDGALVEVGQPVRAGDPIALSGNTGRSTGPHLHFHVSTPDDSGENAFKTFPIRFRTESGAARLREGESYTRPE
jgi:murein DD-endopeptidase MepM/ murein hydrolase activator NlpD